MNEPTVSNVSMTLSLEGAGQAMVDDPTYALVQILKRTAAMIEAGHDSGQCRDYNGRSVGAWSTEIDVESDDE